MATIVYVDGTLQTGSNNGTNWANAYRGCAGMQTALNNVVNGADTIIYARHTFDMNAYGNFLIISKAGSIALNHWLQIIGCDDSGAPYQRGIGFVHLLCTTYDSPIFQVNVVMYNILFRNFWFDGWVGCIGLTGSIVNVICDNCILDETYDDGRAINIDGAGCYGIRIVNCSGNISQLLDLESDGEIFIINSYFKGTSTSREIIFSDTNIARVELIGSILVGGSYGVRIGAGTETFILNNLFYGQNNSGLHIDSETLGNLILNNMFYSMASGYIPIYRVNGTFYEDFNFTNKSSGLSGPNSRHNINPFLVDANSLDFRLQPGSPLLNCGMRYPFGQTGTPPFDLTKFGYSSIGAWQQKQGFISKARIANFGRLSIFR